MAREFLNWLRLVVSGIPGHLAVCAILLVIITKVALIRDSTLLTPDQFTLILIFDFELCKYLREIRNGNSYYMKNFKVLTDIAIACVFFLLWIYGLLDGLKLKYPEISIRAAYYSISAVAATIGGVCVVLVELGRFSKFAISLEKTIPHVQDFNVREFFEKKDFKRGKVHSVCYFFYGLFSGVFGHALFGLSLLLYVSAFIPNTQNDAENELNEFLLYLFLVFEVISFVREARNSSPYYLNNFKVLSDAALFCGYLIMILFCLMLSIAINDHYDSDYNKFLDIRNANMYINWSLCILLLLFLLFVEISQIKVVNAYIRKNYPILTKFDHNDKEGNEEKLQKILSHHDDLGSANVLKVDDDDGQPTASSMDDFNKDLKTSL